MSSRSTGTSGAYLPASRWSFGPVVSPGVLSLLPDVA
jgi:hypothetical protein